MSSRVKQASRRLLREVARPGAVEHRSDLDYEVSREAASPRVLPDHLGVLGLGNAVHLVTRDVGVQPLIRLVERPGRVVGGAGDPAQLLLRELACAGDLALD